MIFINNYIDDINIGTHKSDDPCYLCNHSKDNICKACKDIKKCTDADQKECIKLKNGNDACYKNYYMDKNDIARCKVIEQQRDNL